MLAAVWFLDRSQHLNDGTRIATGLAGYAGMALCIRSAMLFWREDWNDFGPTRKSRMRRRLRVVGVVGAGAIAATVCRAQQTIFNVPNSDVLDTGKTYVEVDALWRPRDPSFAIFTGRGVYGFGGNVEAGVNFGGFQTPGRSVPVATPNVKWQPVRADGWSVTAGAFGLFFLRGSSDGNPAALGYAHVAKKLASGTRLTGGAYWASSGYAAPDVQSGAIAAIEQPVGGGFSLAADWFSGKNSMGYFSPGLIWSSGPWTLYGAWTLKNGDSRGNAALFEAGITF